MIHTAELPPPTRPRPRPASDPGLDHLMAQVRRVAPLHVTVLLTGETGSGKSRLARQIHDLSPRRGRPFAAVDCSALTPSLAESELFGHARGAFTGADRDRGGKLAAAADGTLLLDEVNSLPPALQGKLLRAVEDRVFEPVGSDRPRPLRARVIAASNAPLEAEVAAGRFRADLYHRLNVVAFRVPALRERPGCIVPLAEEFLRELAARGGRADLAGFTAAAAGVLAAHGWPGNVRELRNAVERAVALCPGGEVGVEDLPDAVRRAAGGPLPADAPEVERIRAALRRHNAGRAEAARELGISRVALWKKLRKYGLDGASARAAEASSIAADVR